MKIHLSPFDVWSSHGHYVYAGTSSGFSLYSLAETLRGYPVNAWLGAMLSVASTYLSWRLAAQDRARRLAVEDERRRTESDRVNALVELVQEVKRLKIESGSTVDEPRTRRPHL